MVRMRQSRARHPRRTWEASDNKQAESNSQASGPGGSGAAQGPEKKSGQTANLLWGNHARVHVASHARPAAGR